jgi:hypothetical protein
VLAAAAVCASNALAQPAANERAASDPAPVSATAQRLFDRSRNQIVQVRTLLKAQGSQASVGSGFFVSEQGHILTNYHVVSQMALAPERYRLVYRSVDGQEGALQLLAFDALHDLALVKATLDAPRGALRFRPQDEALAKGERLFSLGNPLDVGFAVLEGNYNGLVDRSFYPSIFFGGALNPGMSGGPALDGQGRVVGVNVATRRDGQQVSFLVPSAPAIALIEKGRDAAPITTAVYPQLTQQLLEHQADLARRFLAQPWRSAGNARYDIPVPQEDFMRCWGRSTPSDTKGLEYEHSQCDMESRVFVSGALSTGSLTVRHETYDGRKLGTLRFANRYSKSFENEWFGERGNKEITPPQCTERFVDRDGLPLRAVLCLTAYKHLKGLYDMSVLVATLDQNEAGVQGRLDARGMSFDNALALADHYLQGYGWKRSAKE